MRRGHGVIVGVVLNALAATCCGASFTDAQLQMTLPDDWVRVHAFNGPQLGTMEFQPSQQNGVTPRDRLTVESSALTLHEDPRAALEGLIAHLQGGCPNLVIEPVWTGVENGFNTIVRLVRCPAQQPRSVTGEPASPRSTQPTMLIKVIVTPAATWYLSRIWNYSEPPAAEAVAQWAQLLRAARLCPRSQPNCEPS